MVYYQPQVGGLCRLHAINGYYQKDTISESEWHKLEDEYDKFQLTVYNCSESCRNFDIPTANGMGMVTWTLAQRGCCSKYIPPGDAHKWIEYINTNVIEWVFMFNAGHIWGIKLTNAPVNVGRRRQSSNHIKNNGRAWVKVDSIGGVTPFALSTLSGFQGGLIIPVPVLEEFKHNVDQLKAWDTPELHNTLKELNRSGNCIGESELLISKAIQCIQIQSIRSPPSDAITLFIDEWHFFLSDWTNGNYNQLSLVNKWIPHFITTICNFADKSQIEIKNKQ